MLLPAPDVQLWGTSRQAPSRPANLVPLPTGSPALLRSSTLPSLPQAAQWQLVALILLKALSVEHAPALRAAFETREGVQRLGKALAGLSFTIEEFYACLELLLPVD